MAKNGSQSALFEKLGEIDTELDQTSRRIEELRRETRALDGQTVNETDLRSALSAFDPVWEQLESGEKARVLEILIQEVMYNAKDGEVSITFRPGGVRTLAKENERGETA